ncbi:actin interacting protein 1 [Metschnikowia bicuspidata var. bicuspidata NRRL YB-4993]|uniref:Actin interacting protein 1 n=1 Tax=Metschnikowia bicuspidata var. bicuspidata NRRL YB-4993 TaxID=869754 RepID=A0A1A0GYZ1_9ASCO|nr:actin interacting protein 1 [Metschnikowia bicuspidata var. bicuspidata NRRL YB-4993]OBA16971.1 actin interacting protein 1 [Metschnikowia bicuspidata var. bicuspidata NRRL YB-4993]
MPPGNRSLSGPWMPRHHSNPRITKLIEMIAQTNVFPPQPATTRGASTLLSYDAVNNRIAYAAGKSVIVRSLDAAASLKPTQFTKHTVTATAAAFSPSGNYIASGDESGHVIVWDSAVYNKEHPFEQPVIKSEFDVLGGPIRSIAWDADNARIIAVGSGKEKFGHCFTWDSGNSIGEIQGHSETINAVDIKPQRPYRAATVGDDKSMVFFTGPPFKFDKSSRNHHTNAARAVKFSPDGKWLVSVGADRVIVLYDGKTGDFIEKVEKAHEGGIAAVAWFPDSASFVTASADNTLKRWCPEGLSEKQKYSVASDTSVEHQQVGVLVTKDYVLSLSLNGEINLFPHDGSSPPEVICGHQKSLTKILVDGESLVTGGSDGTLFERTVTGREVTSLPVPFAKNEAHSNYVASIKKIDDMTVTTGWDDKLKSWKEGELVNTTDLESQPKSVAIAKNIVVLLESKLQVFDNSLSLLAEQELKFVASCVDSVPGSNLAYVTNETDKRLEVFEVDGQVKHVHSYPTLRAAPNLAKVSPNGEYVAVAETTGKYTLYSTKDQTAFTTRWAFHSSRVNGAAWTADSKFLVSGGLDCGIYVYSVARPSKVLKTQLTHQTGVSDLAWLKYADAKGSFASVGLDGVTKTWDVDFSAY